MIVEAVHTTWDTSYNKDRKTVHRILTDESTNKTIVETIQFLYTKSGTIEPPAKGGKVDVMS